MINDCNVLRSCLGPPKADAPLIVDTDSVPPGPIPSQSFKLVSRRMTQVVQHDSVIQSVEFASSDPLERAPLSMADALLK